jgi:signal peptidase I
MADEPQAPSEGIQTGMPPVPARSDQIVLHPPVRPPVPSVPPPARKTSNAPGPGDMKDGIREVVETIVFVVVLVLLLKTFLAEAFVIPTGSMATTLLGYHHQVTCDACGYSFLVNASKESEENEVVTKCFCPNCLYPNELRRPPERLLPEGELR